MLPQFAEMQSNVSLSSDDDTLELSCTASTSSQTTNYGEAGTSFRSEYVVLNASRNFIDNKEFTQVLYRLKLSDKVAPTLAATFIKEYQENVEGFSLSRLSTYRAPLVNRLKLSQNIIGEFKEMHQKF